MDSNTEENLLGLLEYRSPHIYSQIREKGIYCKIAVLA